MNKRYLLILKSKYSDFCSEYFYTYEEAQATANKEAEKEWQSTIIDLNNIEWN